MGQGSWWLQFCKLGERGGSRTADAGVLSSLSLPLSLSPPCSESVFPEACCCRGAAMWGWSQCCANAVRHGRGAVFFSDGGQNSFKSLQGRWGLESTAALHGNSRVVSPPPQPPQRTPLCSAARTRTDDSQRRLGNVTGKDVRLCGMKNSAAFIPHSS